MPSLRLAFLRLIPALTLVSLLIMLGILSADEKPASEEAWWSLKPLKKPTVPAVAGSNWIRNPVDAFILTKLREQGFTPAPEADRRTLIRRLTFDLLGLPPTPDEVAAFQNDKSADAYEKLVDRLLASPHYGERWARHWLDVAHYADSHGQDQDRPRPNAWPYRDYLIRAFNTDIPYGQMIQEQIAGDVLFPENPSAIAATGFLAAGPWDESGLMGIREDSLDRQIAHYLDRDDMVTTTMSTFAGLTVHCARCHDHKFDPITQNDYYSLQAVFAGIDKADREYDADPPINQKRQALTAELAGVRSLKQMELLTAERQREVALYEQQLRKEEEPWQTPRLLSYQAEQGTILKPLFDQSLLAVGKKPDKDTCTLTLGTELQQITGLRLEVLCDETLPHQGPGRCDNGNLHLSEVRVTARPRGSSAAATPVKLKQATADFNQEGWGIARAIDGDKATAWGIYPAVGQAHQAIFTFEQPAGYPEGTELIVALDQLHGGSHLLGRFRLSLTTTSAIKLTTPTPPALVTLLAVESKWRTVEQQAELARLLLAHHLEAEIAKLPAPRKVYCGTNRFTAEGSFKPTATPRTVHVLKRGEITKPGKLAEPGSVAAVPVLFPSVKSAEEGARRVALARWLASPDNPLTWRVIVNRVWHYHFGQGIVNTPNDLGKMGGVPSHPELLDWLAVQFRDSGGSLKQLHKLFVCSSVYRQSTRHDASASMKDADNRLLWRMNRRRLEAESVRDALLVATSKLDATMYGPPVKHFEMKPGIHVTPLADYDKFDVDSIEARRRSIYRYIFRTRPDPMLEALDCPDASQSAPVRGTSVGALQALALWNNKFTLRYAEHLAALGAKSATGLEKQIGIITQRLFARMPTEAELMEWSSFAQQHGLANLCRVFINSSEFLFIE